MRHWSRRCCSASGSTPEAHRGERQEGHRLGRRASDSGELLTRAEERVKDAGLRCKRSNSTATPAPRFRRSPASVDTVLVGRRGDRRSADVLGKTVSALIRVAERSVIVCASTPSPMEGVRGRVRWAGDVAAGARPGGAVRERHEEHRSCHSRHHRSAIGTMVVGEAEALLSLQRVAFVTHIERGTPGEAVARVVQRTELRRLLCRRPHRRAGGRSPRQTPRRFCSIPIFRW